MVSISYYGPSLKFRAEKEPYKVYIGKGNNSTLIVNMFRYRWWWQITDKEEKKSAECQMVWT